MPPLYNHDAWDVAALFDASGNVVQWNTLIAADTGFEQELITQQTTNSEYQSGTHDTMKLACSNYEGQDMLESWKTEKIPLQAVALSFQAGGRSCRWTEATALQSLLDNPQGKRSDGDDYLKAILDGYDGAARYQNLIYGATGSSMILPLAGPTLTLAAEAAGAFTLSLSAKDFSGILLDSASGSFTGERGSVKLKLPANTWTIVWDLDVASDGSLRADGQTNYTTG